LGNPAIEAATAVRLRDPGVYGSSGNWRQLAEFGFWAVRGGGGSDGGSAGLRAVEAVETYRRWQIIESVPTVIVKLQRMNQPHVIGVISDTDGLLRPEAVEALQRSELIIHAGDVGKLEVLDELRKIGDANAHPLSAYLLVENRPRSDCG
jgi:hypothetical protein